MTLPLMPKATAVWLVENTSLTFEQIAEFCGMHPLEVQGIADGEVAIGIVGSDPVASGQLTREEIARCEADKSARLAMIESTLPVPVVHGKGAKLHAGVEAAGPPQRDLVAGAPSPRADRRAGRPPGRHDQEHDPEGARPHPLGHGQHQAAEPGARSACARSRTSTTRSTRRTAPSSA